MTSAGAAAACDPISWLRLERYQLGELPPAEHDAISDHLATCARCRACLDRIQSPEQGELRPLEFVDAPAGPRVSAETRAPAAPRTAARDRWFRKWRVLGFAGSAAATALLVLVMRGTDAPIAPGRRIHTKGGDVALELVRERDGSTANEPTSFAPTDRFKMLLTCPPLLRLYADLAIVQTDGVAFPGEPTAVSCGNRVPLPPAFRITGPGPATICVAVDAERPPPREQMSTASPADARLGAQVSCIRLDRVED
jgi:hypothetical protein